MTSAQVDPQETARQGEPSTVPEEGYKRGLTARRIQMMALGGAIGTGLFYGSGGAIHGVGPILIVVFAVAGIVVFFIMRALGELLTYRPTSGSLVAHAREMCGPFVGFITGWSYWAACVAACMAEVTAAGHYIQYWWPSIPVWTTAAAGLVVLFGVNLISVKIFGELEFWFAGIKVVAILALIVIGVGILTVGFSSLGSTASVTHLWSDGGFAPHGTWTALLSIQNVIFAYIGIELVGLTSGEAANPRQTLRKAINTLPVRIGLFYVGAIFILLTVLSWTDYSPGVSPFVKMLGAVGIPGIAGIMNFVVLTAALSACNTGIYASGRMLRNMAHSGAAPSLLRRLSNLRLPLAAMLLSALVMGIGVVVNAVSPDKAFVYITSVSAISGLWAWASILVSHLRYRWKVRAGLLPAVDYRMPGAPYTTCVALAAIVFVVVLIGISSDSRIGLYVWGIWFVILTTGYLIARRRSAVRTEATA